MDVAAMGTDQFGGDRKSEPAATGPARGLKRLEQMFARPLRNARASVRYLDDCNGPFATAGDANLRGPGIALRPAFQRLRGVAHQIEQHAKQLVWIGVDRERALDRTDPGDR